MRTQQTVVIKRGGRRRNDDSGGGGAWKVAFADFTMAMMALFLILWILSASTQQEWEVVSSTLRNYSIFDGQPNPFELGNSPHPFDLEGYPSLIQGVASEILTSGNHGVGTSLHNQQREDGLKMSGTGDGTSLDSIFESPFPDLATLQVMADVMEEMGRQLGAMDNLAIDLVPQGLRIRLQDNDNRQMFERGGAAMHPFFEDMLLALAPVFGRINNGLVISGHTDTVPYQGRQYGNWELSGDRALSARRVLMAGGAPSDRFLQVVAMSDRTLANPDDPTDSANRRIEILVLTEQAQAELMGLFDANQANSELNQAREQARQNQPITR